MISDTFFARMNINCHFMSKKAQNLHHLIGSPTPLGQRSSDWIALTLSLMFAARFMSGHLEWCLFFHSSHFINSYHCISQLLTIPPSDNHRTYNCTIRNSTICHSEQFSNGWITRLSLIYGTNECGFNLLNFGYFKALPLRFGSRYIKLSSPNLNNVAVAGCILVYTAVILLGLDDSRLQAELYPLVCTVSEKFAYTSSYNTTDWRQLYKQRRIQYSWDA